MLAYGKRAWPSACGPSTAPRQAACQKLSQQNASYSSRLVKSVFATNITSSWCAYVSRCSCAARKAVHVAWWCMQHSRCSKGFQQISSACRYAAPCLSALRNMPQSSPLAREHTVWSGTQLGITSLMLTDAVLCYSIQVTNRAAVVT